MNLPYLTLSTKAVKFRFILFFAFSCLLVAHCVHSGRVLEANPTNYLQLLSQLGPGDTLQLRAGEYRQGLSVHHLNGRPGKPILITGPEQGPRPVFLGNPSG